MTFKVGETVVYPHHGAALIEAIETRVIKGEDGVARVVRFQTKEGEVLEVTDPVFANWGNWVGAKVWITYPPNEPREARIR